MEQDSVVVVGHERVIDVADAAVQVRGESALSVVDDVAVEEMHHTIRQMPRQ